MGTMLTQSQRQAIHTLAKQYGMENVRLFGSAVRGTLRPDSDLDLLVEMENPSLLRLAGFKMQVEALVGRHVDVVETDAITHPALRKHILNEARPL